MLSKQHDNVMMTTIRDDNKIITSCLLQFCSSFFLFPQVSALAHVEPKQWLHLDRVAYFFLIRETLLLIAACLCFIASFRDKVGLLKPVSFP